MNAKLLLESPTLYFQSTLLCTRVRVCGYEWIICTSALMGTWNDALLERVHGEHGLERAGSGHQVSGLPLRGHDGALLEALVVPAQFTCHVTLSSLVQPHAHGQNHLAKSSGTM